MSTTSIKFISAILAIAVLPLLIVEQGWAISILWGWFVVPLGLPEIGIAAAIGVSITASALSSRYRKTEDADKWSVITYALLRPIILVLVGYLVKQFA